MKIFHLISAPIVPNQMTCHGTQTTATAVIGQVDGQYTQVGSLAQYGCAYHEHLSLTRLLILDYKNVF